MFGLTHSRSSLLGIDISSTAIKLIELSQRSGQGAKVFHVEHFAVEPLPPNAVVEKKIADVTAVGQAIKRAVTRSGSKTKRAAVAVAGSAVITKVIALAAGLSDAEMESQIELEADQYIPYPLEEVTLDFNVLGTSKSGADLVDVLLAASRRENVDERVAALELAGLTAAVVDVEAYAMENACSATLAAQGATGSDEPLVIADIGATTTTLHVLHKGQIVYTREQNFGGQQLADEVQRRYGMAREQAIVKVIEGDVAPTYERDVLEPFKEALAQQIGRALQFFYSGTNFGRVGEILLSGGPASIQRIDSLVEERLRVATRVANPFAKMSFAPRIKSPEEVVRQAPALMVAVGLSLRGFD